MFHLTETLASAARIYVTTQFIDKDKHGLDNNVCSKRFTKTFKDPDFTNCTLD